MSWSFPIEVDPKTGKIKMSSKTTEIRQSILLLLKTVRGEREVQPLYGSRLNQFTFEPISYELIREITEEVIRTISYWEKRVEAVDVQILEQDKENSQLLFQISYQIKETKEREVLEYSYRLMN